MSRLTDALSLQNKLAVTHRALRVGGADGSGSYIHLFSPAAPRLTPRLWDISPTVAPDAPIFPGDEPYSLRWTAQLSPHCPVNLSAITMSPHVGAHADAPLHYDSGGSDSASVDLRKYLGRCRVIDVRGFVQGEVKP